MGFETDELHRLCSHVMDHSSYTLKTSSLHGCQLRHLDIQQPVAPIQVDVFLCHYIPPTHPSPLQEK